MHQPHQAETRLVRFFRISLVFRISLALSLEATDWPWNKNSSRHAMRNRTAGEIERFWLDHWLLKAKVIWFPKLANVSEMEIGFLRELASLDIDQQQQLVELVQQLSKNNPERKRSRPQREQSDSQTDFLSS